MSLNWQFKDDEVFEALPKTDEQRRITDSIIWGSMVVGLSEITAGNVDKWLERCFMLAKVDAGIARIMRESKYEEWSPSRDDLKARIGLTTNASTRTDAQFRKYVVKIVEEYAQNKLKQERKDHGRSSNTEL